MLAVRFIDDLFHRTTFEGQFQGHSFETRPKRPNGVRYGHTYYITPVGNRSLGSNGPQTFHVG